MIYLYIILPIVVKGASYVGFCLTQKTSLTGPISNYKLLPVLGMRLKRDIGQHLDIKDTLFKLVQCKLIDLLYQYHRHTKVYLQEPRLSGVSQK